MDPESSDPKDRLRALRQALGLTQQDIAERSGGRLDRVEVNKVENGKVGLASFATRRGWADAVGLQSVDDLSEYVDGLLSLKGVLRIIEEDRRMGGSRARRRGSRRIRERQNWDEALSAALKLFPRTPADAYEIVGDLVDTIPTILDGMLLGEMARSLWEAKLREPVEPQPSNVVGLTNHGETGKKH